QYYCIITDANGSKVTSKEASLTLKAEPLTITRQPQSVTVDGGDNATFKVEVSGGAAPLRYEWHRVDEYNDSSLKWYSDSEFSGRDSDTMTIRNVCVGDDSYHYYCIITDAIGNKVTSKEASLTLNAPNWRFTGMFPDSITIKKGMSFTLSVEVYGGTQPYTYRWYLMPPGTAQGYLIDDEGINGDYSGYTTKSLTVRNETRNETWVWMEVIDANGFSLKSHACIVHVISPK
ncbi:MAG: immunoglobulin domain-containing protein, partial [Firmicutes bacterium]|nr:immunoglobulin domain-containing protein [Bacillota bacterium]